LENRAFHNLQHLPLGRIGPFVKATHGYHLSVMVSNSAQTWFKKFPNPVNATSQAKGNAMRYSLMTEQQKRNPFSWIFFCPKCGPERVTTMNIKEVFAIRSNRSSIVTYVCHQCGYKDDMLID
jgi:hypothetical protein